MKVIKNINNNVSVCIDNDGNELIAFGKGLGFKSPPYEITDLGLVTRTFYDVDRRYFDLLNLISDEVFEISAKVVDYARSKINTALNPNVVFTLADHIQFAIQRYNQNMNLKFSMYRDLKHFNPIELQIGQFAVKMIKKEMDIHLTEDESLSIAMHFINAKVGVMTQSDNVSNDFIIEGVTELIENEFKMKIDCSGFYYSRFASHMEYLLERGNEGKVLMSQNLNMFESIKSEFSKTYECAKKIDNYFDNKLGWRLGEEELLYLILHINKLCAREDCYQ